MDTHMNEKERALQGKPDQQDLIVDDIQDMITNLLKHTIDDMQKAELTKKHESAGLDASNGEAAGAPPAAMGIEEIKVVVNTLQKFLDNINSIIAQAESGKTEYDSDDGKFLDDYLATADNILEIAAFSTKDILTGLSNRNGFDSRLILEWNRAARDKSTLCLLIIGMDGFKYNEHKSKRRQKDEMLKAVSKTLEHAIKRNTDFTARWSDDEFAVLLPVADAAGAWIVAERIRADIESMNIPSVSGKGGPTTVSIGVCVQTPGQNEHPAAYTEKALKALNQARESGRNRIILDGGE